MIKVLSEEEHQQIVAEGVTAYSSGKSIHSCPYGKEPAEDIDNFIRRMAWLVGFIGTDHGWNLKHDLPHGYGNMGVSSSGQG